MVCKKEGKQNFQIILLLMVEQGIIRGCCLHKGKLGFNHSHFVFNTYVACMLFFSTCDTVLYQCLDLNPYWNFFFCVCLDFDEMPV